MSNGVRWRSSGSHARIMPRSACSSSGWHTQRPTGGLGLPPSALSGMCVSPPIFWK